MLDERIELRVRRMWDAGLVDEVRGLAAHGLREGRTANRALGYRQVLAFLDGEMHRGGGARADRDGHPPVRPPAGAWFRKDPRITWVDWDDPHRVERAVEVCRPG